MAGIVAFRHPKAEALARALRSQQVHVMHYAGRLRVAWHGYNTPRDVDSFLRVLTDALSGAA
ncbi:MAG: hypothetical protein L0Z62_04110 [Gemmataceae bacterium]|nr:hypothetical protein [Gemmataceae bacterium]